MQLGVSCCDFQIGVYPSFLVCSFKLLTFILSTREICSCWQASYPSRAYHMYGPASQPELAKKCEIFHTGCQTGEYVRFSFLLSHYQDLF